MSYFSGVTFAQQRVTPADDAIINSQLLGDGILKGCTFGYSGSTLTMDAGWLLVAGRSIRHTAAENFSANGATSGYARLVLTVDLTRSASSTLFEQVQTELQYAAAESGFPDLVQEDINGSGVQYQVALCTVSLGSGGITGIVSRIGAASDRALAGPGGLTMKTVAVSLPSGNWSSKAQTVGVSGVTADNTVIVSPAPASHTAYYGANVRCTAQSAGKLTFACDTVPGSALTVNVLILTAG